MSYTEFYIQPTGNNLNAGSSNSDAAANSYTGLDWNGTTTLTRASGSFVTDGVTAGQWVSIYADGGVSWVYSAQITAVDALTLTVSTTRKAGTAPGSGTANRSAKVAGAWADWNVFGAMGTSTDLRDTTTGNNPRVNVLAGSTYSVTTAQAAVAAATNTTMLIEGYAVTPGDNAARATVQGPSGTAIVMFTFGSNVALRNIRFDRNGTTGAANGVILTSNNSASFAVNCSATNMRGAGFASTSELCYFVNCHVDACNLNGTSDVGGFNVLSRASLIYCTATNCRWAGFHVSNASLEYCTASDTIAGTTGSTGWGVVFQAVTTPQSIIHCTLVNNARAGVRGAAQRVVAIHHSLFVSNGAGGIGIEFTASPHRGTICGNAFWNQSTQISGTLPDTVCVDGSVTLAADPFAGKTTSTGELAPVSAAVQGQSTYTATFPTLATTSFSGTVEPGSAQLAGSSGGLMLPFRPDGGYRR